MLPKEFDIAGKIVFITGAGRGIGRGIAQVLAEGGAQIVLNALTNRYVQGAARDIAASSGQRVVPLAADMTKTDEVQQAVEKVVRNFGYLDVLINCLGDAIRQPLVKLPDKDGTSISDEDMKRIIDINLTGSLLCTRAVGPHFLLRHSGKIVNISSFAAARGGGDLVLYSLAKSALVGFTRAQALEWAPYNIQVNCIAPGSFPDPQTLGDEYVKQAESVSKRVPLGRPGLPREVGLLALYLVSSASDYMTGQTIFLDGGLTL
jgi:NAD(P)-dependent dehydrogenase (short-subunit alcohol dehydrogenase family)